MKLKRIMISAGGALVAVGVGFGVVFLMQPFDAYTHMDPNRLLQVVDELDKKCDHDSWLADGLSPGRAQTIAEAAAKQSCAEAAKAGDALKHRGG